MEEVKMIEISRKEAITQYGKRKIYMEDGRQVVPSYAFNSHDSLANLFSRATEGYNGMFYIEDK